MRSEVPTQRGLVGRRLVLRDRDLATKYAFPFVDGDWAVPLVIVDLLGRPPRILRAPVAARDDGLRADAREADLRAIEDTPLEGFARLAHFDPWWIFRGIGGVSRPAIDAILRTNVAAAPSVAGMRMKVHDLEFAPDLARLEAVVAKDDAFRARRFRRGELDVLALRPPAKTL
jgi:hypothetical protein